MNDGMGQNNRRTSGLTAVLIVTILSVGLYLMRPVFLTAARRVFSTMAAESGMYSMAFVTFPSEEEAKKVAHGLVEKKLAGCVQILPKMTSVYEWEGKINEDSELLMILKTRTSRMEEVSKFVKDNHPYDTPEVISVKIDQGYGPYLKWLGEIVADTPGAK